MMRKYHVRFGGGSREPKNFRVYGSAFYPTDHNSPRVFNDFLYGYVYVYTI